MAYANPDDPRRLRTKRRWARARYRHRKAVAIERLGGRCVDCGESDPLELQLDHIDPDSKSFTVMQGWWRPILRFLQEVDKCELRCVDCHRARTIREGHAGRWARRPWEAEA